MHLLRNFFSGFITFFLVPLLLVFLFLNNFTGVILNKDRFFSVLEENQTFETVSSEILPSLVIDLFSGNSNRESLPKEAVESAVATIDKERLASDLERVASEIYHYTTGLTDNLETKVDLTPYIQTLQQQLKPSLVKHYESLPTCTQEQERQLQEEGREGQISCRPAGISVEQILAEQEIDKLIFDLTVSAPQTVIITKDKLTFDPPINIEPAVEDPRTKEGERPSLEHARNLLVTLRNLSAFLLVVVGALSLLLILSRLPNASSVFRWAAWTFVSAAFLPLLTSSLILFIVTSNSFRSHLSSTLDTQQTAFEETVLNLLAANVSDFAVEIFRGVQLQSFILVVVSAVLFIGALVLELWRRTRTTKPRM